MILLLILIFVIILVMLIGLILSIRDHSHSVDEKVICRKNIKEIKLMSKKTDLEAESDKDKNLGGGASMLIGELIRIENIYRERHERAIQEWIQRFYEDSKE